jgi:DNA-binding CsgD family transcriptional regulator
MSDSVLVARHTTSPRRILAAFRRSADALVFHLAGLAAGALAAAIWIASVTVGLVLAITIIAAPATLVAFAALRWFAGIERRRAGLFDADPIAVPHAPSADSSAWVRFKATVRDPNSWRALIWAMASSMLSLGLSIIVLSAWAAVLYLISLPCWYWAAPSAAVPSIGVEINSLPRALLACLVGIVLLPVAGAVGIVLARLEIRAMRAVLTPQVRPAASADVPTPGASPDRAEALSLLTPREREVLGLMADGLSNAAIASNLVVTEGAVEKHVANIFGKLNLPPSSTDHRRVMAVRKYLDAEGAADSTGHPG